MSIVGGSQKVPGWPELAATLERDVAELRYQLSTFSVEASNHIGDSNSQIEPSHREARYRALLEFAPLAMWITDAHGQIEYANRYWHQYSGRSTEILHSAGWLTHVHPDDLERASGMWSTPSPSQACEHEVRLRRHDGQYRWQLCKGVPIADSRGDTIRWLCLCVDIHDRKMASVAVAEAEEHLRFTLEAAGVGSCGFYPCSEKKEWSGRSADMLGVSRDLKPTLDLFMSRVHPEDKKAVWDGVGALLSSTVTTDYDFDYRIMRPDGTVRWLLSRGKYFVPAADSGEEPRMKGILLDITERKQAEEDKKKLEDQLMLAGKMEAVGRLASGVAHDFNNLITVIRGAADTLQSRLKDHPGAAPILATIHDAAERASAMTDQLLALGRRQVLHPVPLNLNRSTERLKDIICQMLGDHINFEMHLATGLWNVKIDPVQFDQIMLNLAANARDAMPQGGTITIHTSNQPVKASTSEGVTPGEYVCLAFSDNGVGMDDEVLRHIFEPFYTTKELGHGTGVGLATVYGIVQQSGGHISVHSTPGKGTQFLVHLPRTHEAVHAADLAGSKIREIRKPGSILIVDDEPHLRGLLAEQLDEHGYAVLQAASALQALELGESHAIDLLITDVVMEGSSGEPLARQLAAKHPGMHTIFISGYAPNDHLQQALQQPNTCFVQKPFRLHAILEKVRGLVPLRDKEASGQA